MTVRLLLHPGGDAMLVALRDWFWLGGSHMAHVIHSPTCIIHIHALGAREWAIRSRWPATNPANCMRKLAPCNCRASRHSGNPGLGVAFENYRACARLRDGGWSTKSWRARKPLWTGTRLKPLIRKIREWGECSAANIDALVITSFCTAHINHVILKCLLSHNRCYIMNDTCSIRIKINISNLNNYDTAIMFDNYWPSFYKYLMIFIKQIILTSNDFR